jgi:hypothetical protein
METVEPHLMYDLRDIDEPSWKKSRIDKDDPREVIP